MTPDTEGPVAVYCDEHGKIALCENCGQIYSPYWPAAKSAHLHRGGTGHKVRVGLASELIRTVGG